MLSLGVVKDGVILPSDEDRKRIITQMKVRTTLKGDKSWIQQRSDPEEEQNHSPLHSPLRTRGTTGKSPASPKSLSPTRRLAFDEPPSQAEPQSPKSYSKKSPSATSPSGYLIRGVFTKTIDKTTPLNTASNGSQKSAKSSSLPRFSQGHKMSTEEYKKLAPYNIKRELSEPGDVEPSVSPDEQQKRTEAASSVLRRTASRERSYVLSAAKKSNGLDLEDDTGPRSRSQTVPASGWFSRRGKSSTSGERISTSGSPRSETRMVNASSSTSFDSGNSGNQASSSYSESLFNQFSSLENSNKLDQESNQMTSWNNSAPKSPESPSHRSEKNERKSKATRSAETPSAVITEDSWETRKPKSTTVSQTPPHIVISPEANPNRTGSFNRDSTDTPSGATYSVPTHFDSDGDAGSKRSGSWSSESSLSTGIQGELLRAAKRDESELESARSSSLSMESGVATPESQQGEHGSDSDTSSLSRGVTLGMSETSHRMPTYMDNPSVLERDHKRSPYLDCQPNNTISSETRHGMSSYLSNQPSNARKLEISHEITSYLNNQAFNSGSMSYYPFRDGPITGSPRSHRVPFYKDICDTDIRRNSDERAAAASSRLKNPSASGYDSDPTTSSKGLLFVKQSVNSTELSSSPRYNSRSLADLSELERTSYSSASFLNSSPPKRPTEDICTYCGREIRNCAKITIENLRICCHEYCFRCGICHKPMGDLLDKIFIHRDIVHCDKCYEKLF
ncbi:zinc finger protein 185 isoform X6 [Zootoca vivipara]|uniref:zinc finger protein 185 isoform X6 n=1 Tax=Zootoca vivipara TaxID=8524 RepID=UPI00293BA4CF|nr:zinc finger protein 185 isoform X6 [Zootoca vivipara]